VARYDAAITAIQSSAGQVKPLMDLIDKRAKE